MPGPRRGPPPARPGFGEPDIARRRRVPGLAVVIAAATLVLGGCTGGLFGPTFAPTGACVVDGRQPGAYPELEALVPKAINGRASSSVDSGRDCTTTALGALSNHGVTELRFAGATWDEGGGNGVSIAVLALPDLRDLPIAWVEEFYLLGAQNAKHTDNIEATRPTYPGVGTVYRIDTLNDLSLQTVVVWPSPPYDRVVIVATQVDPGASRQVHDARVAEAVGAAAVLGEPSPGCGCSQAPVLPSPS